MRVVLDTNTLVSGVISPRAAPRRLIEGMKAQQFDFYTSEVLLAELLDVLSRLKFAGRLSQAGLTAPSIVAELRGLAQVIATAPTAPRVVVADPDDDHVLACALAAKADLIVSGDGHLLELKAYRGIPIVTPADALERLPLP